MIIMNYPFDPILIIAGAVIVFNLIMLVVKLITNRKHKYENVLPDNNADKDMEKEQYQRKKYRIDDLSSKSMTFEELYEKTSKQRRVDYVDKYLTCHPTSNRIQVYVNRSDIEWIKRVFPIIAPKATVSGFVSNIIADHLKKHEKEIMEMYNENSKFFDYGS